jgi:hypothetical protein
MRLFVFHYCEGAKMELRPFFCRRKYQVISILKFAWILWDYVIKMNNNDKNILYQNILTKFREAAV